MLKTETEKTELSNVEAIQHRTKIDLDAGMMAAIFVRFLEELSVSVGYTRITFVFDKARS